MPNLGREGLRGTERPKTSKTQSYERVSKKRRRAISAAFYVATVLTWQFTFYILLFFSSYWENPYNLKVLIQRLNSVNKDNERLFYSNLL